MSTDNIDYLKNQNVRLWENCEVSAKMINNLANEITKLEDENRKLLEQIRKLNLIIKLDEASTDI